MKQSVCIARLAKAIGYPARIPPEAVSYAFVVDGTTVVGEEAPKQAGGGLVLKSAVGGAEEASRFAAYAAGRMMGEGATLSWDAGRKELVLWERHPAGPGQEGALRDFFERFCGSCDWWRERAAGEVGRAPLPSTSETLVIRP